jgi:hypothetical protein
MSAIIDIQPDGRAAELVIDTGHRTRTGRTWRAFAKVFCNDPFHAQLMAERLRERLGDAIEAARREAYQAGYNDAASNRAPLTEFSRQL